jgi:hypothetical protein
MRPSHFGFLVTMHGTEEINIAVDEQLEERIKGRKT